MKRFTLLIAGALVALFLATGLQVALGSTLAQTVAPFIVNIQQEIPFEATVPILLDDGTAQTVTVPLTFDLNLQIAIDEAQSVVVSPSAQPKIVVRSSDPTSLSDGIRVPLGISQNVDGLIVTVEEIAFVPNSFVVAAELENIDDDYDHHYKEEDVPIIGIMSVAVSNTTDLVGDINPIGSGILVFGSEQIDLQDWYYFNEAHNIDDTIFPGVVKRTDVYFPVMHTEWETLLSGVDATYAVAKATLGGDRRDTGHWFEFTIPPSE